MTTDKAPMTASDPRGATLDQPWNGGPVALGEPAKGFQRCLNVFLPGKDGV